MAKSRAELLTEIQEFMKRHESPAGQWYVGTAKAPREKLFDVHKFKPSDCGLYRQATSDNDAAAIAAQILKSGTRGDGRVALGASSIYIFKMNSHTKPALKAS